MFHLEPNPNSTLLSASSLVICSWDLPDVTPYPSLPCSLSCSPSASDHTQLVWTLDSYRAELFLFLGHSSPRSHILSFVIMSRWPSQACPKHPVQEPLFLQTQLVSVTLLTIVFSLILNLNPQLPSNEDSLEGLMLKLKL